MNSNYNLSYPTADDYYDINIFNNNFSNLADGIDDAKAGGYKSEVIIAAYNSQNPLKNCADFTCTQSDCITILNAATEKVYTNGTIRFLDGDFYLSSEWTIKKSLNIKGDGKYSSTIHKKGNYAYLIKLHGEKIIVENIGIECNVDYLNYCLFYIANDKIEINNCYFNVPLNGAENEAAPIILGYNFGYTAIRDCLFEKYKNTKYIVRAEESDWRGIMTGNFVTNIDSQTKLPVAVNLKSSLCRTQIDFGSQDTAIYIKGAAVS